MYAITTDGEVEAQIDALPTELLPYLAQLFDVLELVPWNSDPYNEAIPGGIMRKLLFGPTGRAAEAIFLIVEDQQRVDILRITWIH
jgi:hypothetical protein